MLLNLDQNEVMMKFSKNPKEQNPFILSGIITVIQTDTNM